MSSCTWRWTAGSSRPATERAGGWWGMTYRPRFFDRNQAIPALTVTELLESSRDSNDPVAAALRQELLNGSAGQAQHHPRSGRDRDRYRP